MKPVLFSSTQRFRAVLAALRAQGVDVTRVLAEVGVSEAQLLDPQTRVPREITIRLSQALVRATHGEQASGLLAARYFTLSDLGLLGYITRHSEHALGALQRFVRYSRLIADAAKCQVVSQRGQVVFRAGLLGGRALSPQGVDYAMATVLCGLQELTEPPIAPRAVSLSRPAPADAKPYHALFGVRVQFDAEHSELIFEQSVALQPLMTHDPQLLEILEQHAQHVVAALPSADSFVMQVREFIATRLPRGAQSAASTAQSLGISARTLRRKLERAGFGYRSLLEDVRRERALTLIADQRLNVTQLAQQVGFSDPSAFASAFRRWTGKSPAAAKRGDPPKTPQRVVTRSKSRSPHATLSR